MYRPDITITNQEIDAAVPMMPSPPPVVYRGTALTAPPAPSDNRVSRLAIAALVVAVLGIVAFGLVTGMVAVVLGCVAIGTLGRNRRGGGLALAGIVLGVADVVVWLVAIAIILGRGGVAPAIGEFEPDATAWDHLAPEIRQAMLANVLVETRTGFFAAGMGSGIILHVGDRRATVLTNRHVIDPNFREGASDDADIRVKIVDQPVRQATVEWVAPDDVDLALLTVPVEGNDVTAANWQSRARPNVGDEVFAIGNPHNLGWTHTRGTVSQFRVQRVGDRQIHVIQTDVAVNPGNSGGGLYDKDGRLIGINTWTNDKRFSEGLGFAISVDVLWEVLPEDLLAQLEGK